MISILFLKEAIYCNIFRYNYLWNKKVFVNFLLHFLNLDSIFKFFKKKDDPHSWYIFELMDTEKRA